jgi:hypothetical protein
MMNSQPIIKFWHSLPKQAGYASKLWAKDLEIEEG